MVCLETNLGTTRTESLVFEHPTIEALVRYFLVLLFEQEPVPSAAPPLTPAAQDPAWNEKLQEVAGLDDQEVLRQLRGGG